MKSRVDCCSSAEMIFGDFGCVCRSELSRELAWSLVTGACAGAVSALAVSSVATRAVHGSRLRRVRNIG